MKKLLALLLVAVMALTMTTACGGVEPVTETPAATTETPAATTETPAATTETTTGTYCQVKEGSDITVLNYSDIATFFPADITQGSEFLLADLAYESLCEFDEEGLIRWMLATGCDVSEDGLEYVFTLRQGITFSDGEVWNAEAMKANFDMMLNPDNALMGVSLFADVDHCEVVDEYTAKLVLKQTYAPLLSVLATYNGFVSPALIAKGPEAWKNEVVGTGMYTLADYSSGAYATYALRRDYWGYDPDICGGTAQVSPETGFSTITVRPVAEEATRIAMLLSGEADIINSITASNIATVESGGNTIISCCGGMVGYMYFNCGKGPLKDAKVRNAIAMAIDCETLNQLVYGGMNKTCDSMIPPAISFYEPQEPITVDVEAAKALLAEAGYPDGFELVAWEENDTSDIQRGQFIQQQLEQIGIKVTVYPKEGGLLATEVGAYDGAAEDQGFDLYIRGYGTDTYDADEMLGRFSTPRFTPDGSNYSFYSNAEFDELIDKGGKTTDQDERQAIYSEAQKIIWADMPAVPLLVNGWVGAYGPRVKNMGYSKTEGLYLKGAAYNGD